MNPSLEQLKDIAAIVGGVVGLATLIKSAIEYTRQGAQKRAEQFVLMRQRFKGNLDFKNICDLLETDDQKLIDIPFKEKRDFLGFFEEIALMVNSKLIGTKVAHYMFGYYAIKCWESNNFWRSSDGRELNRDSIYWSLFRNYASDMKLMENSFAFRKRHFKF